MMTIRKEAMVRIATVAGALQVLALAGLAAEVWESRGEIASRQRVARRFEPQMSADERE